MYVVSLNLFYICSFMVYDFLFSFSVYLFILLNSFLGCIAEGTTGSEGIALEHVVFHY